MSITLFEQHEQEFTSNGLGILDDVLKCVVTEVRNGKFELEMEYPIQGEYATELKENRYIYVAPNDYDAPHPFRIYEVASDLAAGHLTIKAVTKADELSGNLVKPFALSSGDPRDHWRNIQSYAMDPIKYQLGSNILTRAPIENDKITNLLAFLNGSEKSIVSEIGGEIKYGKNRIDLFTLRGREHVTTIRPRKNLKNIKIKTNMHGKYTRILPYAKYTPEGENKKEVTVYGDVVRSDHYDDYYVKRIIAVDLTSKFNDEKASQKQARKEKLEAEKNSNRSADRAERQRKEQERQAAEDARERERLRNHEEQKRKRAASRAASIAKRGQSSGGGRKSKAQRAAEQQARYDASDAAYAKRESEAEAKWNAQQQKRNNAKRQRAIEKAAREEEKARRAQRQAQIKEETKFVITKAMVDAEAATYFDDNPKVDIPNITIEVDMLPLADTTVYERGILNALNRVMLCDTIDIYVPKLDVDVTLKIVEIEYDCLAKRILKIVATSEDTLPSTLADSQRGEYKDAAKRAADEALGEYDAAINSVLTSANGNNRNFYGPDEPPAEGLKENDLWFKDVGEGKVDMYRYDGMQWILILPSDFGEVLQEQIDEQFAIVRDELDQYSLDMDLIFGELADITDDAFNFLAESKESIESELATAKSKLEHVENEFNSTRQYLNDRIVQIAQESLNSSRALITKVEKDIKDMERGVQKSFSQLRIGSTNILKGVMAMTDEYWIGGRLSTDIFSHYNRKIPARHLYNAEFTEYKSGLIDLKPNTTYTFSFYARLGNPGYSVINIIQIYPGAETLPIYSDGYNNSWRTETKDWNRYYVTFTTGTTNLDFIARIQVGGTSGVLISGVQLEESSVLSDWHPNSNDIEQSIAVYKEGIDGQLSVLKRTLGTLENGLTTVTNKVENIPGKITLEVNTAKEELKKFTISQIEISEDRISSSVTSNVNGIISSSVNQSSGIIRQAITSANDSTKSYAQSIVQQEANARQTSLTQINNKLTDYNIVKERVDLFSRTLGRTEGDLSTNIANMLMTNDSFQTMISNVDVRRQNLIKDTDTFKTMKPVGPNNISLTVLNTAGIQLASDSKNNSWGGFTLPLTINSLHPNKKYTISFEIVIWEFYPGETSIGVQLKNHNDNKGVTFYHVPSSETPKKQSRIRVKKTIDQKSYFSLYQGNIDLYPFYVWLNGRGRFSIYNIMLVEGDQISSVYSPNNSDAITTLVRQTSTQYAVNILSGSRELITEINASPDGVRIKGKNIELDGQALIHNAVIKNGMIADAAINKAKIANASIVDGHIVNLNANKLVGLEGEFRKITAVNGIFNNVFTAGLDIGNTRMTFSNGSLDILRKGGVTTDVTIRSNGRYSGPTQFNGRVTNSIDYVPVMTNLYQDYPLRPVSRRTDVSVYGVRGLFLITFRGQTNEYGSSAWLYVNDGSSQNHTWYVPMKKAQTQISWHGGFDS
jgi:phage minor structural protein